MGNESPLVGDHVDKVDATSGTPMRKTGKHVSMGNV